MSSEPRVTLDPRGQLIAEDKEALLQLASKSGSLAVAPTSPDWVCLLRLRPTGKSGPRPRVVMAGDAAGFPLSDLVAFLGQSKWSGVVRVHGPAAERSVLLKEGEVRGATSDDPADRLGELMVRQGHLDREQLDEVLKDTPPSKVGRALVDRGLIQAHDLWKCLTEQVSEIFHSILLCREGVFLLVEQDVDDKSLVQNLNLSTQSLLMDSIRKIDEMALFRKRIPHGRVYVVRRRGGNGKLEPDEDRVLALANGDRTVLELGAAAKLSEFDATRAVYRLLEGGYVSVQETPEARGAAAGVGPDGKPIDPPALLSTFNAIYREILAEVAKQDMEKGFLSAANAALGGTALTPLPIFEGVAFSEQGTLPEGPLLERYRALASQLGSEPLVALRQLLSDVMFFLLFQAGELLESRADEDLARRVKEMLAKLDG